MTTQTTTTTPAPVKTITLKSGATITVYWSKALGCYVTIPESGR